MVYEGPAVFTPADRNPSWATQILLILFQRVPRILRSYLHRTLLIKHLNTSLYHQENPGEVMNGSYLCLSGLVESLLFFFWVQGKRSESTKILRGVNHRSGRCKGL